MKRLPLVASFLLFIVLCASLAYWALELFKPPQRPVAAPPRTAQPEIRPEAATALFGGRTGSTAVASNYQLKGVIFSGNPRDSVAILGVDGKPAQALRVGKEIAPGVTIEEVHRQYVLLTENGATKRVELPANAPPQIGFAAASPVRARSAAVPASQNQNVPMMRPPAPPPAAATAPPPSTVVVNPSQASSSPVPAGAAIQPGEPVISTGPPSVGTSAPNAAPQTGSTPVPQTTAPVQTPPPPATASGNPPAAMPAAPAAVPPAVPQPGR